ncbi:PREDICTED: lys-63-specific deubiquitinase BRCC36-like isoform X1 [Ceratosolen solmsi marchali]|uniref:Lys-63-specific deubiquitinase BRCC36-like isoform X1 n=1 Tax=Ceratosolen solmsi marchali TaxID=326594 RepID=A0AAJ7DXY1_9HYME|nr:PREDICTED: lys-63-specific deubiquitinase BRCC36-like isoform X1 [Ceratosolen solmsi marchali]
MTYPLKKVTLKADVYMVCLEHALSTENFEVMGLLIGDNVEGVTSISAMKISSRSDKKKDRVEISPSESVKAWEEAERLTKELHKTMRVIGWYHSHPHITICPSQIDINTQQLYQTMERSFVGLIFSVFSEDQTTKEQEVMLTCFQSCHGSSKEIPLEIIYTPNVSIWCCRSMIELPQILVQEEKNVAENYKNHPDILVHICNNAGEYRK